MSELWKNEATTHIKQVINGDTAERHLCSECAEHLGYGDAFSGFGFDVAGLSGISSAMPSIRSRAEKSGSLPEMRLFVQ